ncbi:uncharacterized protein PRCAT00002169001 [Priceomyces carsonii]|uniref:uncharacterized protein n=1 Tax=Priceomyces carsonii TaxID=28549 RepID=UPI002ED9A29D|nr:unnamed protein product [Priceomyces carsonii]
MASSKIIEASLKLNDGNKIPVVGLGTWQASEKGQAYLSVSCALKAGYRHIDTASGYENEAEVGMAIRDSKIPREEIFLTTKLWCQDHKRASKALDESLEKLGLDYVDLYLMHWPVPLNPSNESKFSILPNGKKDIPQDWTFLDTYKSMQKLVGTGKVKSIGVSNFSIKRLEELLSDDELTITPAVNQVEVHPLLPQDKLIEYCHEKGIIVEAYSPLGSHDSPLFKNKTIVEVAERNNVTTAQVLIAWGVHRGTVVLPKSVTPSRIKSNILQISLPEAEYKVLDKMPTVYGIKRTCNLTFNDIVVFNDDD